MVGSCCKWGVELVRIHCGLKYTHFLISYFWRRYFYFNFFLAVGKKWPWWIWRRLFSVLSYCSWIQFNLGANRAAGSVPKWGFSCEYGDVRGIRQYGNGAAVSGNVRVLAISRKEKNKKSKEKKLSNSFPIDINGKLSGIWYLRPVDVKVLGSGTGGRRK